MDIRILGPLQAWENGHSITPTASKHRQVLALLAMRAGELVTVAELTEELWETNTPRSAPQCLQTYILRLRQIIQEALPGGANAAKDVLITRPCGYSLDISPKNVDVHRFTELVAAGERAADSGDNDNAAKLFGAALARWRGPALVDVPVGPRLAIEIARLDQSRLSALESRIDADLERGRHHRLLGELAELTARYPMHEKLCAQYMTALYVSGCKWRALEAFRMLRQRLVDELGLEPSVEVQRVQRAILKADTEPARPAPRATGGDGPHLVNPLWTYAERCLGEKIV